MMNRVRGWIGCLFLISLFSCNAETSKLDVRTEEFHQKACHREYCAEVKLTYPLFLGEGQSIAELNTLIEKQVLRFLESFEERQDENIQTASKAFLDGYLRFMDDFESSQEWELNLEAKVSFENEKMLSIVFETYSYTGGAHPNGFRHYLNFDKQKNIEITNTSLVKDEKRLIGMAESKFREIHQVEKDIPLRETEMFFLDENDEFFLPSAIGIERDSLVLFYNPYEIGPYVMGSTEIKLATSNLKDIVNLWE